MGLTTSVSSTPSTAFPGSQSGNSPVFHTFDTVLKSMPRSTAPNSISLTGATGKILPGAGGKALPVPAVDNLSKMTSAADPGTAASFCSDHEPLQIKTREAHNISAQFAGRRANQESPQIVTALFGAKQEAASLDPAADLQTGGGDGPDNYQELDKTLVSLGDTQQCCVLTPNTVVPTADTIGQATAPGAALGRADDSDKAKPMPGATPSKELSANPEMGPGNEQNQTAILKKLIAEMPTAQPAEKTASTAAVFPLLQDREDREGQRSDEALVVDTIPIAALPARLSALHVFSTPKTLDSISPDMADNLARIADTLAIAKETQAPWSGKLTIEHAEFGNVTLRFDAKNQDLSVSVTGTDPGLQRAITAAIPPEYKFNPNGADGVTNQPPLQGQMQQSQDQGSQKTAARQIETDNNRQNLQKHTDDISNDRQLPQRDLYA